MAARDQPRSYAASDAVQAMDGGALALHAGRNA